MPRTGENIYKRKDGRWEGRYIKEKNGGKAKYGSVYARSYKEVKGKLEEAKKELDGKKSYSIPGKKMEDIGRNWLSEISVSLKESSANKYEDILRCYIFPEFGENELSEITNQHLMNFVNNLLVSGGVNKQGLASATVIEIMSVMNRIRIYAMRKSYPVAFSVECISLKREYKNIRVFSLEEEGRLLNYLQKHMELPELGILLCLFTGIRVGELCAIKWDDIDISEKKLSVRKTLQRLRTSKPEGCKTEVKLLEPKSSSSVRDIPLPDALMELLEKFYISGAFLLTGENSRFIEPRTMQNRFKKIIAACGIQDANFHTTRHTFATRCIELGFDVKSLSEILGHANVAITMNRYVHPSMELKRENMNRFSDLFTVK
ncbi:tyrosine-type recombinase/integrase [Schaedlerella arabinosiphila]|nr:site-specific integrase [Schaedlerella arabinosiphila]